MVFIFLGVRNLDFLFLFRSVFLFVFVFSLGLGLGLELDRRFFVYIYGVFFLVCCFVWSFGR